MTDYEGEKSQRRRPVRIAAPHKLRAGSGLSGRAELEWLIALRNASRGVSAGRRDEVNTLTDARGVSGDLARCNGKLNRFIFLIYLM
jgi:hypothetical protein